MAYLLTMRRRSTSLMEFDFHFGRRLGGSWVAGPPRKKNRSFFAGYHPRDADVRQSLAAPLQLEHAWGQSPS
jgi:hypothetical protein